MLAWQRYKGLMQVGLLAALGLAGIDLTLRRTLDPLPYPVWFEAFKVPAEQARLGGRMADYQTQSGKATARLVFILGLSSARVGFDPTILERGVGSSFTFLNLGSSGSSMEEIEYAMAPLARTDLRPEAVLLVINPFIMGGRPRPPVRFRPPWPGPWAPPAWDRSRAWLLPRIWLVANDHAIHNLVYNAVFRVRDRLAGREHFTPLALFPPEIRSAEGHPSAYLEPHAPPGALQYQLRLLESDRLSVPIDPALQSRQILSLLRILHHLQAFHTRILVVLPPEASWLRRHVPAEDEACLKAALRSSGLDIPIYDLRDQVPDGLFYDLVHVNPAGRDLASHYLSEGLQHEPPFRPGQP
jgi:hypothetical protein